VTYYKVSLHTFIEAPPSGLFSRNVKVVMDKIYYILQEHTRIDKDQNSINEMKVWTEENSVKEIKRFFLSSQFLANLQSKPSKN